jgi:hypothetical protein
MLDSVLSSCNYISVIGLFNRVPVTVLCIEGPALSCPIGDGPVLLCIIVPGLNLGQLVIIFT